MNITMLIPGTYGDVTPYVALEKGLQQVGYRVTLVTHERFEALVKRAGLEYGFASYDPRQEVCSAPGKAAQEKGDRVLHHARNLFHLLAPKVLQMGQDCWQACQNADAILYTFLSLPFGASLAEKLKIPAVATAISSTLKSTAAFQIFL